MKNIDLILQHDDFIIVNKPANQSFHSESGKGFAAELETELGYSLWAVHRLDKITSGLIIFAKSAKAAAHFNQLFQQHKIHKTYLALSDKKPKKKQGKIIGDMAKTRSGSWKLTQEKINPAITRFQSFSLNNGLRLFFIQPKTGKTHQIRVALKSISAPILGDLRYKGTNADRGYLHAYQLAFDWQDEKIQLSYLPNEGKHFINPDLTLKIAEF